MYSAYYGQPCSDVPNETQNFLAEFCLLFWIAAIECAAWAGNSPLSIFLRFWTVGMLACVPAVAYIAAQRDLKTTMWREVIYFFHGDMVFMQIIFWPFAILGALFLRSGRTAYISNVFDRLRRESHNNMRPETARSIAEEKAISFDLCCDRAEGISGAACRKTVVAAALSGVGATAYAQQQVTVNTKVASIYMVENGKVPHQGPVSQTDITATYSNGLFLNLWTSTGFDFEPNGGREIDWTIGWSGKHSTVGGSYFDFDPLFSSESGDIVEIFFETKTTKHFGTKHQLTPYFRGVGLISTNEPRDNSSAFISGGLRHTWQLSKRWVIGESVRVLCDTGTSTRDGGFMGNYEASVGLNISDHIAVMPFAFRESVPIVGIHDRTAISVMSGGIAVHW